MVNVLPGDVLFVWGDDLVSDAIELVTHGPSHSALILDETTVCEAQGGRPIGSTPLSYYIDNPKIGHYEIWRDPTLTDPERTEMVRYAKTLYGIHYDYLLIPLELLHFEFGLHLDWYHENHHRICSTFIHDIASSVGRKWSPVNNPAPIDHMIGGKLQQFYVWDRSNVAS